MGKRGFQNGLSLFIVILFCIFSACSPSLEDKDPKARKAAVEGISDQALLAKVALEDQDYYVRKAAVKRLEDQSLLAKLTIEIQDSVLEQDTFEKISDETAFARIAIESGRGQFRESAVENLTLQPLLERVASESKFEDSRRYAVMKLTNQALLAKIAIEDDFYEVCIAAIDRIADQSLLAQVAFESIDPGVRETAITHLTDTTLKSKLANPVSRANAIGELKDSDPRLRRFADEGYRWDARGCIARMKLAIQEPRIKLRLPRLQCLVRVDETRARYSGGHAYPGERVTIKLRQDGKTLAEASWSSKFDLVIFVPKNSADEFNSALVKGEDLLKKLLEQKAFAQDDFAELVRSEIAEVRIGAAAHLTDPALLAQLAIEDADDTVRRTAVEKLTDQTLLNKIALEAKDDDVRQHAKDRLAELLR